MGFLYRKGPIGFHNRVSLLSKGPLRASLMGIVENDRSDYSIGVLIKGTL